MRRLKERKLCRSGLGRAGRSAATAKQTLCTAKDAIKTGGSDRSKAKCIAWPNH
jgi:hypothetical protein